jgi:hypothetical protein
MGIPLDLEYLVITGRKDFVITELPGTILYYSGEEKRGLIAFLYADVV